MWFLCHIERLCCLFCLAARQFFAAMAAASSSSQAKPVKMEKPRDDNVPDWVLCTAKRIDAYKGDVREQMRKNSGVGETDPSYVHGATIWRGRGLVYAAGEQTSEHQHMRAMGAVAASFVPQRHIGMVCGRPCVVISSR